MNREQWQSILRGAALAATGAFLAFVTQKAASTDLGPIWGPALGAALSVAANVLRKYVEANSELKVN